MDRKNLIRKLIPVSIRGFIWRAIPKIHLVNTYVMSDPEYKSPLNSVNKRYVIKEVGTESFEKLRVAFQYRGHRSFEKRVPARLHSQAWKCLAVFDREKDEIAYTGWIIVNSIPYLEEFGIRLEKNDYLLKDGYCVPDHRHQGLHTRMEQERINYCIKRNARKIYIQIHADNPKGIYSVLGNGYTFFSQRKVIQWPLFNVFRELKSFLKRPFRKVIK